MTDSRGRFAEIAFVSDFLAKMNRTIMKQSENLFFISKDNEDKQRRMGSEFKKIEKVIQKYVHQDDPDYPPESFPNLSTTFPILAL